MNKVFSIEIDESDDLTGVDFVALVTTPATNKKFIKFSSENPKPLFFANDDEQVISGVMIAANKLIPRVDNELGRYDVFFTPKTIKDIVYKFFKNGFIANVNEQHNPNLKLKDIYLFESFIVDGVTTLPNDKIGSKVGDWVASYKVNNSDTWNRIKNSSEFSGFSVEGYFNHKKGILTKNKIEMKKEKTTIKSLIAAAFSTEEPKAIIFGSVSTIDGLVLAYEGEELAVGTPIMVEVDGTNVAASEGVYALGGDMDGKSLILDANGVVAEILDTEAPAGEVAEEVAEVVEAVVEQMKAFDAKFTAMFKALENENKELKGKVAAFAAKPAEPAKTKLAKVKTQTVAANPILNRFLNN